MKKNIHIAYVSALARVENGQIVSENSDFLKYLSMFEGQNILWSITLLEN